MSATATSTWKSPSHTHSHSHSHTHSRSSRPSTTPRTTNTPFSVGQNMPPLLSPRAPSPHTAKTPSTPSPNYFGFVVAGDDSIPPGSNPGHHARQNWEHAASQARSVAPSSHYSSIEISPEFAAFRKQSEERNRFSLSQNLSNLGRPSQSRQNSQAELPERHKRPAADSPLSPRPKGSFLEGPGADFEKTGSWKKPPDADAYFGMPRQASPPPMSPSDHNHDHHMHARLSLPGNRLQTPPLGPKRHVTRSETLPIKSEPGKPALISPKELAELLDVATDDVLLLDLRVYPQYMASRIRGALNLCIPTTLLKRPSFTTQKLAETFNSDEDRAQFEKWKEYEYIVVYDANSVQMKEAVTPLHVLKKFAAEGWTGQGLVVRGGFFATSKAMPSLIEENVPGKTMSPPKSALALSPHAHDAIPVAGGCSMPSTKSAANPFFGNIRQNMDLMDGVGQMPVKRPAMSDALVEKLPTWLRLASRKSNEGKLVSDKFLHIEKTEQKRMQEALSGHVSYGTPGPQPNKHVQVAGIEKGSKNRYNNIFPYDHSRVHLQGVRDGDCDYINANYVQSAYSNRKYIATQAPIPATFDDFWRVVWEQDVRVVIMLTAESEGGQIKSHPYWNPGSYGPLKLKKLSEKRVVLNARQRARSPDQHRPSLGPRRSTNPATAVKQKLADSETSTDADTPAVVVRHFTLSHAGEPFKPLREITQLHYSQWPDFGTPAEPTALISLIDQMNKYIRGSSSSARGADEPAPAGERPIVVHCSAGCGRTGTFCTIDSVLDMLKRQREVRQRRSSHHMDIDAPDDWVHRDDIDLVAKAVEDFRAQRLSMVQNLRQFVLCYESVLEWMVEQQQQHDQSSRSERPSHRDSGERRSYHRLV